MRTDSGLTPGLSDTIRGVDGELALDREGRSGVVEQAVRATRSARRVRGQIRRAARCLATPRTVSAASGFVGSSRPYRRQVPLERGPGERAKGRDGGSSLTSRRSGPSGGVRLQSDAFDETSVSCDIHVGGAENRLTIESC
jgi:hypothetical protein